MTTTPPAAPPATLPSWSPGERESFFTAIARHRARAWRVDLAARACALVLALLVAVLLGPLLSLLWRRRKPMADATAVLLTRDPDGLGQALAQLRPSPGDCGLPAWVAHMALVPPRAPRGGILQASPVGLFPGSQQRIEGLARLGATLAVEAGGRSWGTWLGLSPALALVAALVGVVIVLLVYVSLTPSLPMTGVPGLAAGRRLRWLAG